jgi:hypothetical protein
MAAARGIDLISAAQNLTALPRKDTLTRTRCGLRITQLQEASTHRAYGKETPTMAEPDFSAVDAGFALQGVARVPTLAALYAWADQRQNYWTLVVELRTAAVRLMRRECWPTMVENHAGQAIEYIERLCEMVLFEDKHPGILDYAPPARVGQDDQTGIIRAICCEVTLPVWKSQLADRYACIYGIWMGWLHTAAAAAQRNLREDDD